MRSGRETLGSIDNALTHARKELDRLDRELQRTSDELAANRRARARTVRELAGIRLGGLAEGAVEALDSADRRAQETLSRRAAAIDDLEGEIELKRHELAAAEERRELIHGKVEQAAQALAELEATVQASLERDESYLAQLERAKAADAVAAAAEEKTRQAELDRAEKGEPFEADDLFMYLWRRGYATPEYRANPLARAMDAWVARLIRFREARATYWTLLEIPKRLAAHAEREREEAADELTKLEAIEKAAADAAGVGEAQALLATVESEQDQVDEALRELENTLADLRARRAGFAAGEDEFLQRGLAILAEALQRRELRELRDLATATSDRRDDGLVDELDTLRRADHRLVEDLADRRGVQATHLQRVKELEAVRRQFKRHRYDDLRSVFDNDDLIGELISEFLRGAIGGSGLWDAIRRQQRYRDVGGAWPDFGSGGMGRRRRQRSPWHWPGGAGGGFRLPRGGGSRGRTRSRGGFRTGGGF